MPVAVRVMVEPAVTGEFEPTDAALRFVMVRAEPLSLLMMTGFELSSRSR